MREFLAFAAIVACIGCVAPRGADPPDPRPQGPEHGGGLAPVSMRAAPPGASPVEPVTAKARLPVAPKPAVADLAAGQRLARELLILDGHVDLPWRIYKERKAKGAYESPTRLTSTGDFDAVRARRGGLDAPFMSIYVPVDFEAHGAMVLARELIGIVDGLIAEAPGTFAHARSPAQVRENARAGKISLPMGLENGAPLEGRIENLAALHRLGIRYITLAHGKDNHVSDSSYDDRRTHGGLSPFGKTLIAEMNAIGMMIDVSHISDAAFWQVIELSRAPVIASHSSCRHFTPGFERNMSDEMIVAMAKRGGVIMINFGSIFVDDEIRKERAAAHDPKGPGRFATVAQVADHIQHVVEIAGIEHVGLGSDFDGVGDSLPTGLKSVEDYPNLFVELLRRGYSEDDIAKIAGENAMRVWQAVEVAARPAP